MLLVAQFPVGLSSTMVSTKLVVVLLMALGACQATNESAQPKNLQDVITIAVQIFQAIVKGILDTIEKVRSTVDELILQLNQSLGDIITAILKKAETAVNDVINSLNILVDHLGTAIPALNAAAGDCVEQANAELDPLLDASEGRISDDIDTLLATYPVDETLASLKEQADKLAENDDAAITRSLQCVSGKTGVKACLDESTEIWYDGLTQIVADTSAIINGTSPWLSELVGLAVSNLQTIGKDLAEQADPIIAKFGTCVESS